MTFKHHPTGGWACRFLPLLLLGSPAMAKPSFELMTLADSDQPSHVTVDNSSYPALSADGRYVTFLSPADDLVATATVQPNVFLRAFGRTLWLSTDLEGKEGGSASGPISDVSNGCAVAFESSADLIESDTNGVPDIYLKKRCADPKSIVRISKQVNGDPFDAPSSHPDITPDGKFVVYENAEKGVMRYDTTKDQTLEITGGHPTGKRPAISDDGSRVVFYSASALIPSDQNEAWDIYLWDSKAQSQTLRLVSTASDGTQREVGDEAPDRVTEPAISGDGSHASFATSAANLAPGDTNGVQDVFIKDLATGEIKRASVTETGEQGNGDSPGEPGGRAALSKDGTWVVFESKASNLTGGSRNVSRTVVRNLSSGETISLDGAGDSGSGYRPAISGDAYGRFVAFYSSNHLDERFESGGVFRFDRHKLPVAVAAIDSASPQQPKPGDTVILDGSGSTNEANTGFAEPGKIPEITFQWTQRPPGVAAAPPSDPAAAKPSIKPPKKGSYLYQLVVSDPFESSDPAEIVVHAGTRNKPPIADAGVDPGSAEAQSVIHLNGRGSSDPEGRRLRYHWSQLTAQSTAAVPLYRPNTATPTFVPGQPGTYVFKLRVDDGLYLSDPPATVSISVGKRSEAGLIANAGENAQDLLLGDVYRLDGSASLDTATGTASGLRYSWKILSAPNNRTGSRAKFRVMNPHSPHPRFLAPIPGTYVFGLTVSKNGSRSAEKAVSVGVSGAITSVDRPTGDEAWTMGSSDTGTIAWHYGGISPNHQFVALLYSFSRQSTEAESIPAGACINGCLLRQGIRAGQVDHREIKISVSQAKVLAGYRAQVAICLPGIGGNDPLCQRSALFHLD